MDDLSPWAKPTASWSLPGYFTRKRQIWNESVFNDLSIDNVIIVQLNNEEFEELKGYDGPTWSMSDSEMKYRGAPSGLFRFDYVNPDDLSKRITWYMWPHSRGVVDADHIRMGSRVEKNLSLDQIEILRNIGSQVHVRWKISS